MRDNASKFSPQWISTHEDSWTFQPLKESLAAFTEEWTDKKKLCFTEQNPKIHFHSWKHCHSLCGPMFIVPPNKVHCHPSYILYYFNPIQNNHYENANGEYFQSRCLIQPWADEFLVVQCCKILGLRMRGFFGNEQFSHMPMSTMKQRR